MPQLAFAPLAPLFVLAAVLLGAGSARADRSRLADEGDVMELGDCEAGFAVERRRARGEPHEREAELEFGCGVGAGTEVVVKLARTRAVDRRERLYAVEAKTEWVAASAGGIGWTLAYGAEFAPRWRASEMFVAVEATRRLGGDATLAELRAGVARDRIERRFRTLWSLGVEHALVPAFELVASVGGDDRERPVVEAGVRWLLGDDDAAVTLTLGRGGGPPAQRRVGLAVTVDF